MLSTHSPAFALALAAALLAGCTSPGAVSTGQVPGPVAGAAGGAGTTGADTAGVREPAPAQAAQAQSGESFGKQAGEVALGVLAGIGMVAAGAVWLVLELASGFQ